MKSQIATGFKYKVEIESRLGEITSINLEKQAELDRHKIFLEEADKLLKEVNKRHQTMSKEFELKKKENK